MQPKPLSTLAWPALLLPLLHNSCPTEKGDRQGLSSAMENAGAPGTPNAACPCQRGKTKASWHGGRWAGRSLRHWPWCQEWWSPAGLQGARHKGETEARQG